MGSRWCGCTFEAKSLAHQHRIGGGSSPGAWRPAFIMKCTLQNESEGERIQLLCPSEPGRPMAPRLLFSKYNRSRLSRRSGEEPREPRAVRLRRRIDMLNSAGDVARRTKPATTAALHDLLHRIEGDYRAMPGLSVTAAQAERLWGLDTTTCSFVLMTLIQRRILVRTPAGTYVRR